MKFPTEGSEQVHLGKSNTEKNLKELMKYLDNDDFRAAKRMNFMEPIPREGQPESVHEIIRSFKDKYVFGTFGSSSNWAICKESSEIVDVFKLHLSSMQMIFALGNIFNKIICSSVFSPDKFNFFKATKLKAGKPSFVSLYCNRTTSENPAFIFFPSRLCVFLRGGNKPGLANVQTLALANAKNLDVEDVEQAEQYKKIL